MSRFVEEAMERAGLGPIRAARQAGNFSAVRTLASALGDVDLLALGAYADALRALETGEVVRVHPAAGDDVHWVRVSGSELDLLRAVAMARITVGFGARVGVDWGATGMEVAQVALGFGATDLTGPITRKSGTLIGEDELKKVKGQGMVAATALKRREIAQLVRSAGRQCEFTDEEPVRAREESAHA